jgi:hypothetical protein
MRALVYALVCLPAIAAAEPTFALRVGGQVTTMRCQESCAYEDPSSHGLRLEGEVQVAPVSWLALAANGGVSLLTGDLPLSAQLRAGARVYVRPDPRVFAGLGVARQWEDARAWDSANVVDVIVGVRVWKQVELAGVYSEHREPATWWYVPTSTATIGLMVGVQD